MTAIRNGSLWTCHVIGLNGTNGVYHGNETGTNMDRSAVQWIKCGVDAQGGSLSYAAHGRVYDTASTNAYYYYVPSVMVNCAGDIVLGFSGSSAANYIGAFYTWRLANGATLGKPRLIRDGTTAFNGTTQWCDYSATTLDPTDDWSFWAVQEYADPPRDPTDSYPWATVIAKIRPRP
jgi:hypothetical protein